MAEINLEIKADIERITVDDLIALEEDQFTTRFVRDLIAKLLINPATGEFYPEEEARKIIGKLSVSQLRLAAELLVQKLKGAKDASFPSPQSGS